MLYSLSQVFANLVEAGLVEVRQGQANATEYVGLSTGGMITYVAENFLYPWLPDMLTLARVMDHIRTDTKDGTEKEWLNIEVFTGPSPILRIAVGPYTIHYRGLDFSSKNVLFQNIWNDPHYSMPEQMRTWLTIAAIIHGMGSHYPKTPDGHYNSEQALNDLARKEPETILELGLGGWTPLGLAKQRDLLDRFVPGQDRSSNPYLNSDFRRAHPAQYCEADMIGTHCVPGKKLIEVGLWEEKADRVLMAAGALDSVDDDPIVCITAFLNALKLVRDGGKVFCQNVVCADGYPTFYTLAERAVKPPLKECFWTKEVLDLLVGLVVQLDYSYNQAMVTTAGQSLPVYNASSLPGDAGLTAYRGKRRPDFTPNTTPRDVAEALIGLGVVMEVKVGSGRKLVTGRCLEHQVLDTERRLKAIYTATYKEPALDGVSGLYKLPDARGLIRDRGLVGSPRRRTRDTVHVP